MMNNSAIFNPKSVAVVGVSSNMSKVGSVVFSNLVKSGFPGDIYPIGRNVEGIAGHRVHQRIGDIGQPVDLIFLASPATMVGDLLEEAAEAGVKAAIIGSSGFAESGATEEQARLTEIADRTGLRLIGPNCNGLYNANLPLSLGFNRAHARQLQKGGVAIVSHSGALFDPLVRMLTACGSGLSCFVSAGNEADLNVLDYVELALGDVSTRVIALLIDSIDDAPRFVRIVEAANALGKPIVALKIGVTDLGAGAAIAHSSRLTGDADAYAALFDALGVPVATTLEGLIATASLLDRYGRRQGKLAAVTTSGAGGALVADLGSRSGIAFADYTAETAAKLQSFQAFSVVGNPTDIGIFGFSAQWDEIFGAVAQDENVGAVLAYIHSLGGERGAEMCKALGAAQADSGKPVIVVAPGGFDPDEVEAYRQHALPVLSDTSSAIEAMGALLRPAAVEHIAPSNKGLAGGTLQGRSSTFTEGESLAILGQWGVPVVPFRLCKTADEAVAAAEELGWPVAVKSAIPGLAHKTEEGLVQLDLETADALKRAVEAFGDHPLIVQPMIAGSLEAIIGVSRTPGAGPMLLAGLGGIYAEAISDVMLCPIDTPEAVIEAKLSSTALGRIFDSPRWAFPGARQDLMRALLAVQAFALDAGDDLEAVDINPLILGARGAIAVDALIVPRGAKS